MRASSLATPTPTPPPERPRRPVERPPRPAAVSSLPVAKVRTSRAPPAARAAAPTSLSRSRAPRRYDSHRDDSRARSWRRRSTPDTIERMGAFPPRPGTLERLLRAKGAARAHSRRPPPEISCHRPARARRPAASASVALAGVISKRLGTLDSPLGLFRARDQSRVLSFFRRLFTASEEQPSRRRCSPPRPRQTSAIGAPCRRDQL